MSGWKKKKAKTESIIAAIGDGIGIHGRDLTILYQNQIHISYFGDHRGEKCYQAYGDTTAPCIHCPVLTSFNDGRIHSHEMVKPAAGGSSCFEITASPLRDATGGIIAGITVARNIDRRKRLEREREKLIEELQEALANNQDAEWAVADLRLVQEDPGRQGLLEPDRNVYQEPLRCDLYAWNMS